ncbi:SDR family NAD(P)-dependent oxidoreductase [Novosphingobium bradum]|uniref:SDR family NAD(P)-dependent oxidoreductase n=1 Tax=Novosphingobium bradum TaxID=1737444 RepID=A0ABV7IS29_9SPHN
MGRLTGKRALMTGAGGLLGSELCRGMASEGADLILTTRTAAKLAPLAEEIRGLGVRAATVAADFTKGEDMDRLASEAWDAFGGIDVVVFSSQPSHPRMGDLLSTSEADFRDQFEAQTWGLLRLMRNLHPKMVAAGGASIITFTSSCGFDPAPGYDAYGMGKAGLWWLTKNMAAQWGKDNIRANAVQPGTIITGDAYPLEDAKRAGAFERRVSLRRGGRNDEVVGAVVYFASDESSYTSGQLLAVNGGRF